MPAPKNIIKKFLWKRNISISNKKREDRICNFCSKTFNVIPASPKKFCNHNCYSKWMKTQNKNNSLLIRQKAKKMSKLSKTNKNYGMKNKKQSNHCKKVQSKKRKNKKYEEIYGEKQAKEIKKKMSKTHQLKKEKLGYVNSKKTREKLSQYKREKASQWRGGKSFEPYGLDFNNEIKEKIRKKNKYKCQLCNKSPKYKLSIHHIDYNKKNNDEKNLVCLCKNCHSMTNSNRKKWERFFKNV